MEKTGGLSLFDVVQEHSNDDKVFSENEIWNILTQGVMLLAELSKYGVVHGNINEYNLHLSENSILKLVHFEDCFVLGENARINVLRRSEIRSLK